MKSRMAGLLPQVLGGIYVCMYVCAFPLSPCFLGNGVRKRKKKI